MKKTGNTQGLSKTLEKSQGLHGQTPYPKVGSKSPRSWEKTQGVATLVQDLSNAGLETLDIIRVMKNIVSHDKCIRLIISMKVKRLDSTFMTWLDLAPKFRARLTTCVQTQNMADVSYFSLYHFTNWCELFDLIQLDVRVWCNTGSVLGLLYYMAAAESTSTKIRSQL